jgi:hypothetical protein
VKNEDIKMNEKQTEIVVLMDASGSMGSIRDDVVGGFNNFIDDQKKLDGEARLTATFFDNSRFDKWQEGVDIKNCPELGDEYRPGGSTPLLDATGRTIEELGARLEGMDEADRPGKVMVIIMTDGYENSSCVFTNGKIRSMIKHQEQVYSWEFIFLGAGVDAFTESQRLGMKVDRSAQFERSSDGVNLMFSKMSSTVGRYRDGQGVQGLERGVESLKKSQK